MAADPLAHLPAALFRSMGVDGVYARSALYVHVCERLEGYISRLREPQAEVMRFPPLMSRKQLEKSGYLKSFPEPVGLRLLRCTERGLDSRRRRPVTSTAAIGPRP